MRKLTLAEEPLRILGDEDLARVVGGTGQDNNQDWHHRHHHHRRHKRRHHRKHHQPW